jgi:hypothetical protein
MDTLFIIGDAVVQENLRYLIFCVICLLCLIWAWK